MTALLKHLSDTKTSLEAFGSRLDPPVNKSTVWRWTEGNIPAERVLEVERMTGVSRHELRPDVFGPAPAKRPAAAQSRD